MARSCSSPAPRRRVASWTGKGMRSRSSPSTRRMATCISPVRWDEQGSYVGRATGGFGWKWVSAVRGRSHGHQREREAQRAGAAERAVRRARERDVGETKELPWQLTLAVPKFDPRKELLPDSSIESLADHAARQGDLTFAERARRRRHERPAPAHRPAARALRRAGADASKR